MRRCIQRAIGLVAVTALAGCPGDAIGPTGPGNQVAFGTQPQGGVSGAVLPPVSVTLSDGSGNPASGVVSIAIHDNRCSASLTGTLSRQAVDGIATFSDLRINVPQDDYRLEARTSNDTTVSTPFDVVGGDGEFLRLTTTLCSKPNDQRDAESLAYVPGDDQFWIGDDDLPSVYHIERGSGSYVGRLDSSAFAAAFPETGQCDDGDGNPATSCSYLSELEILTYDETNGFLYIINTVNSPLADPPVDKPAIFRLRKEACAGCLSFDGWQELSPEYNYHAAVTISGTLYIAVDALLYAYDYDTNTLLVEDEDGDPLPPTYDCSCVVRGLAFDGNSFWLLTAASLRKLAWGSMDEVFRQPLAGFGITLPKGITVVGGTVYILDGNQPNRIYVFRE